MRNEILKRPHTGLLWAKCLYSHPTTLTQTFIYLNPTHGQPVCSCVCERWAGKRGMLFMVLLIDRLARYGSYSRGIRIYFPCAHISGVFFSVSCLILTKCRRFWHASIFCAPVTNKEKWAAESQGCEGGSLLSGADTAGTTGAQIYNKTYPLQNFFLSVYRKILVFFKHVPIFTCFGV